MRQRILLAVLLLSVILSFMPVTGYGEVKEWMNKTGASYMEVKSLEARVNYMMRNPTSFYEVNFYYDPTGEAGEYFPEDIDTKGKICVDIRDNRDAFSGKSGIVLLVTFKEILEALYLYIKEIATDMNNDIVAVFFSKEDIPLGYFHEGVYSLWEKG